MHYEERKPPDLLEKMKLESDARAWLWRVRGRVTGTAIKGQFWDIRSKAIATFVVDLATGTHEGGIREIDDLGTFAFGKQVLRFKQTPSS